MRSLCKATCSIPAEGKQQASKALVAQALAYLFLVLGGIHHYGIGMAEDKHQLVRETGADLPELVVGTVARVIIEPAHDAHIVAALRIE